ncbi:MAG: UPF0149 family protein [Thiothrix sp.]
MSYELPDYGLAEKTLGRAAVHVSAAELHGVCCGFLAVNPASREETFVGEVLDGDPNDFYIKEARLLLSGLFVATREQLSDPEMGFALLLPEDADLSTRVEAMQDWCQGCGSGGALAGVKRTNKLPKDSDEWLADVAKIGTSGELELDEDAEASENALAEIIEYLRIGVLMLREEFLKR